MVHALMLYPSCATDRFVGKDLGAFSSSFLGRVQNLRARDLSHLRKLICGLFEIQT